MAIEATNSRELIYFPYQPIRPGFPGCDIYRAEFCLVVRIHQKEQPLRKQVPCPGPGGDGFMDGPYFSNLYPAAAAIFISTWSPDFFLCAKINQA